MRGKVAAILLVSSLAALAAPAVQAAEPPMANLIPSRQIDPATPARDLKCTVSHIANLDISRDQRPDELQRVGNFQLGFTMPPAVNPRKLPYRMTTDQIGIIGAAPRPFERVTDIWPHRVEMATTTPLGLHFVIVSDIDVANGRANLALGRRGGPDFIDPKFYFTGTCTVQSGRPGRSKRP